MTVTVDLVHHRALALLKDLESFNIIRLVGPLAEEDAGRALAAEEPCPLCAQYHEPNEETIAAMEEGDAIARGDIPAQWYHSADALLADLHAGD